MIQRQLARLRLNAEFAGNGRKALEMARTGRYALLLSDLHMPEMDGYALARALRKEGAQVHGAPLPILALTADARQEVMDAVRGAGMDGLLIKPVTLKALDMALRPWLVKNAAVARESAVSPVEEAEGPVLDLAELTARIGDDEEMQHEFLGAFRDQMSPMAAQIAEAAMARDLRQIGALAHRLKSSSRAIGAMDLGAVCARIEEVCRKEDADGLNPLLVRFGKSSAAVGNAITRAIGDAGHVRH